MPVNDATERTIEPENKGGHQNGAVWLPPEIPETPASLRRERALIRPVFIGSGVSLLALTLVALRPTPNRVDVALTRLLQRRKSRGFFRLMRLISAPGYAPFTHTAVLSLAAVLWSLGQRRHAVLCVATMGAGTATGVLKMLVSRPRPDQTFKLMQRHLRDKSFPSGHATHYTSFYGYIFVLAYRQMKPSLLRTSILTFCALLILLVGPSRVYLGHHWASDVVAGELVGLTYLFGLIQIDLFLSELSS